MMAALPGVGFACLLVFFSFSFLFFRSFLAFIYFIDLFI